MKKGRFFWFKVALYVVLAVVLIVGICHYSSIDFSKVSGILVEGGENWDVLGYEELSGSDLSFTDIGVVDEELYENIDEDTCIVKVLESINYSDYIEVGMTTRKQTLYVEVLTGPRKGEKHYAVFDRSNPSGGDPYELCEVGDRLLCFFTVDSNGEIVDNIGTITDFNRMPAIIWTFVIFMLLLLFLAGRSGVKSFAALLVTCVGIILIILPMMLSGVNPIIAAIFGCIFVIVTTLVLVYGFTVKTFAAALGALGGVIVAGVFTAIMNGILHMTGAISGEANMLALHFENGKIDLNGIMFAAILIGSLGGTIDVGVSIASSLDEMREHAPNITAAELAASGLRIGSDIMSASLNTLILAYVGSAIHLLLMLRINGIDLIDVLNQETISSEFLRALAGSFGLLFTVPITSFVAGAMLCKGGLGKFSIRMFPTMDSFLNFIEKAKNKWGTAMENAKQRSDEKYGITDGENLYERVQRHYDDFDDDIPTDDNVE